MSKKLSFVLVLHISIAHGLVINSAQEHAAMMEGTAKLSDEEIFRRHLQNLNEGTNGMVITVHQDTVYRNTSDLRTSYHYDDPCELDPVECHECGMPGEFACTLPFKTPLHICTVPCKADADCPTDTSPGTLSTPTCILADLLAFTKWSDNAVAYKSKVALSFTACHWMQMFGIQLAKGGLNETNECFSWVDNYGEPCHLKGKVDRYYGKLKGAVLREAKGRIVKGMHDIKSVLERSVTARPHRPDAMEEVFIEHWPECDRADWIRDHRCIAVSSMPCKIRASNCYSHTMNDVRRRRVLGDDGALITAVTTRAHGLPGLAAIPRKKIEFCEFEPPLLGPIFQPPEKTVQASDSEASTGGSDSEAATSESDAAVEADFTEVPENQAVYRGWKCSYRTKKAEQPKKKKLLKKNKARNALYGQSINHDRLELATRHMQTAGVDRAAKLASRRLDQDAAREARRKFADPPSDCNSSSSSRSGSE